MSDPNRKTVNLPDADDMRARLEAAIPDEHLASLIPHLLREVAGKRVMALGVLNAIRYGVDNYEKQVSPLVWAVFREEEIYRHVFKRVIEAIVDDEDVKRAALHHYNGFLKRAYGRE